MTKMLCVGACLFLAIDCVMKGTGAITQAIFSDSFRWFWYVAAIGWILTAISAFLKLEEK